MIVVTDGGREKARWIRGLLHKLEEPSSGPQQVLNAHSSSSAKTEGIIVTPSRQMLKSPKSGKAPQQAHITLLSNHSLNGRALDLLRSGGSYRLQNEIF